MSEAVEVAHVAHVVANIESAMEQLSPVFGGTWTEILPFDVLVRTPLDSDQPSRVTGRFAWLSGQQPPLEIWEGPLGSPWHHVSNTPRQHHIAYWVDDLDVAAAKFATIGFEIECTPVHDGEGILGFAYLRNPEGTRIELQAAADKPFMMRWLAGEPLKLDWMSELR